MLRGFSRVPDAVSVDVQDFMRAVQCFLYEFALDLGVWDLSRGFYPDSFATDLPACVHLLQVPALLSQVRSGPTSQQTPCVMIWDMLFECFAGNMNISNLRSAISQGPVCCRSLMKGACSPEELPDQI